MRHEDESAQSQHVMARLQARWVAWVAWVACFRRYHSARANPEPTRRKHGSLTSPPCFRGVGCHYPLAPRDPRKHATHGTRIQRLAALVGCILVGVVLAAPGQAPPKATASERLVHVAGGLGYEELVVFTASLAASGQPSVVLIDTPTTSRPNQEFLKRYQAERVVPVGSFPEGGADLEKRLGLKASPPLEWKRGPPAALWQELFPRAERVIVCPSEPRRLFLQSACLAGALGAPLYVVQGGDVDGADLRRRLSDWRTREVLAIASAAKACRDLPDIKLTPLVDERAVIAAYRDHQLKKGPIDTIVVANPDDAGWGRMSSLAPWIALQRRALLLLTNKDGDNTTELVRAALKEHGIQPEFLILAASLEALPMETRPNPVPGKDAEIEMEPLTPKGKEPFTFATGRLFHEEPGMVALMLARRRLLEHATGPRKALVVSNPGDSLPLLETFSRHTASEIRNSGYQTTAMFGEEVSPEKMRQLLPEQDIFLWEGHYKTLIDKYQFLTWKEPLRPSLIFLQSCLALNEEEAHPLFERGAVGIVGSSTRIYSGTGGAFTLAYFDAMLYDDLPLGAALRQAKNYLLAYSILKQQRLNGDTKLSGANIRSSWAFTLWGDPTLKLPRAERPADALPAVRHRVKGDSLTIYLPEQSYETVVVGNYEAKMRPNARLAGLLTTATEENGRRHFVPFIFAEVKLPKAPPDKVPHLTGTVPEKNRVFLWDKQRSTGYLMLTPRSKTQQEIRFKIVWEEE